MSAAQMLSGYELIEAFQADMHPEHRHDQAKMLCIAVQATEMTVVHSGSPKIHPEPAEWIASTRGDGWGANSCATGDAWAEAVMRCYLLHIEPRPPRVTLADRVRNFFKGAL